MTDDTRDTVAAIRLVEGIYNGMLCSRDSVQAARFILLGALSFLNQGLRASLTGGK